ncbi:MAG TPA: hypothetical protein VGL07_16785 [Buttiauxella sp.]|jgi:hypothetical protein
MALKKPSQRPPITPEQADAFANQFADRPYAGIAAETPAPTPPAQPTKVAKVAAEEKLVRTTMTIPPALLERTEDLAIRNKRSGIEPKNVSAIVRAALEEYLAKHE